MRQVLPANSNVEWRAWGKTDPLWGAAARHGKRNTQAAPWTAAEFYDLGAADWREYHRHWMHYGLDTTSCIEIGCGPGRLTAQLATVFDEVHAVDVSADMVAYARGHITSANTTLHVTNGDSLPVADNSMTATFSVLTFRHFDEFEHALVYFREVHRVLATGGTLFIELPIHTWPSGNPLFNRLLSLEKAVGQLRATYRRFWLKRERGEPFWRRRTYEVMWLLDTLEALGFVDVEVRLLRVPGSGERHWCVLARKS